MHAANVAAAAEGMSRHRIERMIEHLIEALDSFDGDPDFEPGLGLAAAALGGDDDREQGDDDEPDFDQEMDTTPEMADRPLFFGERP